MPVSSSYMASLAPAEMRGRYQGVVSVTWSSATMVGPALGLALYHSSPATLWLVLAGLGVLSALLILATQWKLPAAAPDETEAEVQAEI
jgi:MFS family permease